MDPGVTALRDPSMHQLVWPRKEIQRVGFIMSDNNDRHRKSNYVPSGYSADLTSLVQILWELEGLRLTYLYLREIHCKRKGLFLDPYLLPNSLIQAQIILLLVLLLATKEAS